MKTKTKQTARTGTESENGHHRVGFQWGEEGEEQQGKGTRKKKKKHNWQA